MKLGFDETFRVMVSAGVLKNFKDKTCRTWADAESFTMNLFELCIGFFSSLETQVSADVNNWASRNSIKLQPKQG